MDVDLPQRPAPGVDELVGHARRRHHYLPGARLDGGVADGEGGLALQRHEDLLVRMLVQPRTATGGAVHQEERYAHVAVAVPFEPARGLATSEFFLGDYVRKFFLADHVGHDLSLLSGFDTRTSLP